MNDGAGRTFDRRSVLKAIGLSSALGGVAVGGGGIASCAPVPGEGIMADRANPTAGDFSFASWSLADTASKDAVQGLVDRFARSRSVAIKGVPLAYDNYLNQLVLQVRGGRFAGAVQLDIAWLSALVELGRLRDLGPEAAGAGYTDIGLRTGRAKGVQYGLPWTTGAIGLIANEALLERAGIGEPPTTIDDFESALVELRSVGKGVIPYAASTKTEQLKDVLVWMETFGSPLLEGEKVTIGDEPSVEAIAWYKRLYDRKLIAAGVDRTDARNLFSQGKAAIFDDAIIGKDVVVATSPDAQLGDKLVPLRRPVLATGDRPRSQQWGHVIAVVDGEGSDTAAEFARWLTSDRGAVLNYFDKLGLPPSTVSALKAAAVRDDEFTTLFGERVTATATANPFWRFPQFAQMETVIAERVQAVLAGSEGPKEAMQSAGKAVQDLV